MKRAFLRAFIASLFNCKAINTRTRVRRYLFLAFFLLTSVVGSIYRACAWDRGLRDLGLADAWSNIWAVPTSTFWWTGFFGSEDERTVPLIAGSTIGFIVYELMQVTGFIGLGSTGRTSSVPLWASQ